MTKANVIQLGLLLFLLGLIGYGFFIFLGFDNSKAVIVSQALLVLLLIAWVSSYFFRVVTGSMTFNEQRKRYLEKYDQITDREIKDKFESMSNEEKLLLMKELESDSK